MRIGKIIHRLFVIIFTNGKWSEALYFKIKY